MAAGAHGDGARWEHGLRELTEVIRRGLVHLGRAEVALVKTGNPGSVSGEFDAAVECDRRAQYRMDYLLAELRVPDQRRLVAQAVSKGTITMLMQSFSLYRMTLDLVIRAESLGGRGNQCSQALSLAKEFAASSMLLAREAPGLEQRHLLKAVNALNALGRDFDDRFLPVFNRIAEMHNQLVAEGPVPSGGLAHSGSSSRT